MEQNAETVLTPWRAPELTAEPVQSHNAGG